MSKDPQSFGARADDATFEGELRRSALVACLVDAADLDRRREELRGADVLEVRADRVGDLDVAALRDRFAGRLLYTLRTVAEGGAFDGTVSERRRRLRDAASQYDLVDLELETDTLDSDLLVAVPAERRLLSWHGRFGDAQSRDALDEVVDRQFAIDAAQRKIVAAAETAEQALRSIEVLVARRDSQSADRGFTCFAMGDAGAWTRPLAARLGGALTFASIGESAAAGQWSLSRLVRDYALDRALPSPRRLFGVVGSPVLHSLSPRLHNAAYLENGLEEHAFVPFETDSFDDFWDLAQSGRFEAIGLELGGFAVTTPHKEPAARRAGLHSDVVAAIGAGNTLVPSPDGWRLDSTDPDGVVGPLRMRGLVQPGLRAAVIGAGGAGRAAVVGLRDAGADVILVNRTVESGRRIAEGLGVAFVPLVEFEASGVGVIVNATSLGHQPADPLPFDCASTRAAVVDMVYRADGSTDLIEAARRRELVTVDGREVLLHQALSQFERMTGFEMDGARAARRLGAPWSVPPTEELR